MCATSQFGAGFFPTLTLSQEPVGSSALEKRVGSVHKVPSHVGRTKGQSVLACQDRGFHPSDPKDAHEVDLIHQKRMEFFSACQESVPTSAGICLRLHEGDGYFNRTHVGRPLYFGFACMSVRASSGGAVFHDYFVVMSIICHFP